jgi:hypothetical protein
VSLAAELRPDISEAALDRLLTHSASSTNSGVKAVYQRAAAFQGVTFGTEILGTLIAVYGLFITPHRWEYAFGVRVSVLVWLLIDD